MATWLVVIGCAILASLAAAGLITIIGWIRLYNDDSFPPFG